MSLWGWIPNLSEGRSPVPVPAGVRLIQDISTNTDRESPVCVVEESVSKEGCDIILMPIDGIRVRADIVSGFFVIREHVESILKVEGLDEYIYMTLRKIYHLDVTHGDYGGLRFINAESLEDAVKETATMFVSWTESMNAERLYDNLPPASEYIARSGFIKYGISFVNSYREELGQDAKSYLEILSSLDLFYGTSYDHYKNENMERLTQASTELARRSTILAEKSMTFTKLVFFLTISGIIIAIADLSLTHWESSSLLFTVVLVVILLLACGGYLYYSRFGTEKETINHEESSGDDAFSLSQCLGGERRPYCNRQRLSGQT